MNEIKKLEGIEVKNMALELAKFEVCNQRNKVIGEAQTSLFSLATGPSHNEYLLKSRGKVTGRLMFDLKMSQQLQLSIKVNSLRVKTEDTLQFSYYNFCLKMPSMHYNLQTCFSHDLGNPGFEANGFFQESKRSFSKDNSSSSKVLGNSDGSFDGVPDPNMDELISKDKKFPFKSPEMRSIKDINSRKKGPSTIRRGSLKIKTPFKEMVPLREQEEVNNQDAASSSREIKSFDGSPLLGAPQLNHRSTSVEPFSVLDKERKKEPLKKEKTKRKFGCDVFTPAVRRKLGKIGEKSNELSSFEQLAEKKINLDQEMLKKLEWTFEEAEQLGRRFPHLRVTSQIETKGKLSVGISMDQVKMGIDEMINSSFQVCVYARNNPTPDQDESMVSDKMHLSDNEEDEGKLIGCANVGIRRLFNQEMEEVKPNLSLNE